MPIKGLSSHPGFVRNAALNDAGALTDGGLHVAKYGFRRKFRFVLAGGRFALLVRLIDLDPADTVRSSRVGEIEIGRKFALEVFGASPPTAFGQDHAELLIMVRNGQHDVDRP